MKEFIVFDFMKWLINREEFSIYGIEYIEIFVDYFFFLFFVEEREKNLNEFFFFKIIMNSLKNLELYEVYCYIVVICFFRVEIILK